MKKVLLFTPALAVLLISSLSILYGYKNIGLPEVGINLPTAKVYVALEGEGKLAVLNADNHHVITYINLTIDDGDSHFSLSPHNVSVSPDFKNIWVSANLAKKGMEQHGFKLIRSAYAHSEMDYLINIDPSTDKVIGYIPIAKDSHLAHVVINAQNSYAYVTSQEHDAIYKIDTHSFTTDKIIQLPKGSSPHGLRISTDNTKAYVAEIEGKAMGILDLKSDTYSQVPLEGKVVQSAVTNDNKYVFASLYDLKSIVRYEIGTGIITRIQLPADSHGPIQLYPTPDSKYIYVADQGYYFSQPASEKVYKIDAITSKVIKEITVGSAPHGVVVSSDGRFLYITNLLSDDISVVDTSTDTEIARIKVGDSPNGITYWRKL
jgi:YVTN family beta-propeller protein